MALLPFGSARGVASIAKSGSAALRGNVTLAAGANITLTQSGQTIAIAASSGTTSPLTTKGDLWGYDSANNRIPVGSNGTVLTADSTQALGVKWAAAPASSSIATGTTAVTGGAANAILYEDGSQNLAASSTFVYDGTHMGLGTATLTNSIDGSNKNFVIGGTTQPAIVFKSSNSAQQVEMIHDGAGLYAKMGGHVTASNNNFYWWTSTTNSSFITAQRMKLDYQGHLRIDCVDTAGTNDALAVFTTGTAAADTEVARFDTTTTGNPYITLGSNSTGGGYVLYNKTTAAIRFGAHSLSGYNATFTTGGGLAAQNSGSLTPSAAWDVIAGNIGDVALKVRPKASGTVDIVQVLASNGTSPLLIVDKNGKVGIGASSPSYALDVAGTSLVANFGTDPAVISVGGVGSSKPNAFLGGGATAFGGSTVYFAQNAYFNGSSYIIPDSAAKTATYEMQAGNYYWYTGGVNVAPGTIKMTLTNAGRLGLGDGNTAGTPSSIFHLSDTSPNLIINATSTNAPEFQFQVGGVDKVYFGASAGTNSIISGSAVGDCITYGVARLLWTSNAVNGIQMQLANGLLGVGVTPGAYVDVAASTTSTASFRIRSGTAPTTPNNGDIWFDGTNLKIQIGGVTKTVTVT